MLETSSKWRVAAVIAAAALLAAGCDTHTGAEHSAADETRSAGMAAKNDLLMLPARNKRSRTRR